MSSPLIQSPPVTDPTLQPVDAMVDEVAQLVGGSDDPEARAKAIICLDRAADRLNMRGIFLFRLKGVTYASAAAGGSGDTLITNGAQSLTKPSDFAFPYPTAIVYDTSGDQIAQPKWHPWDLFLSAKSGSQSSVPSMLSLRSVLDDGIFLWPYADTGELATIEINYYARVQRPSETASISLLPEVREALISGGEYFMMRYRYAGQPRKYQDFKEDFRETIAGARGVSNRWLSATAMTIVPDLDGYITQPPRSTGNYTPGTVYLKL